MSYEEKNITVSLMAYSLILGYFLMNLYQMIQAGGLISYEIFGLWLTVILATIIVNIIASILINILFSIIEAIKTQSKKHEPFIADERDKLIGLKGTRISYIFYSIGVGISMLTLVFDNPPLLMFSLLIFFSIAAEIVGNISQLYFYRRGF